MMRNKNSIGVLCGEGGKDRFENNTCSSRGPPNSLFRFWSTEEVLGCEASEATFFFWRVHRIFCEFEPNSCIYYAFWSNFRKFRATANIRHGKLRMCHVFIIEKDCCATGTSAESLNSLRIKLKSSGGSKPKNLELRFSSSSESSLSPTKPFLALSATHDGRALALSE